jgi:hypothetical protein
VPRAALALVLSLSLAWPARAEEPAVVPNASLKKMYLKREKVQHAQGAVAVGLGGALLVGALISFAYARNADSATALAALPWGIDFSLLAVAFGLGGAAALGPDLHDKADALSDDGSMLRADLIAQERHQYDNRNRVLAISLGVGGGLAALGVAAAVGFRNDPGWKSAGAATLALGTIVAALGVLIWNEARHKLEQLDRGVIEDLDVLSH